MLYFYNLNTVHFTQRRSGLVTHERQVKTTVMLLGTAADTRTSAYIFVNVVTIRDFHVSFHCIGTDLCVCVCVRATLPRRTTTCKQPGQLFSYNDIIL